LAAYSLFKEKYPKRKKFSKQFYDWLDENFSQYDPHGKGAYFNLKNLHKWKGGRPFKEMQWEGAWDNLKIAQKISNGGVNKEEMIPREIMRMHSILEKELKDLTGFILSQHSGNKKILNKFIFDRPA